MVPRSRCERAVPVLMGGDARRADRLLGQPRGGLCPEPGALPGGSRVALHLSTGLPRGRGAGGGGGLDELAAARPRVPSDADEGPCAGRFLSILGLDGVVAFGLVILPQWVAVLSSTPCSPERARHEAPVRRDWSSRSPPVGRASFALGHGGDHRGGCPRARGTGASCGGPGRWSPGSWSRWLLSAWLYGRGLARLWRDAGVGRGMRRWEASCFAAGWLALALALVSPLHPWGSVLFSAHMTQHELMMLVAAPLLVLGRPVVASLKALPAGWPREAVRGPRGLVAADLGASTDPFVAWLVHAVVLWAWHIPALFQATIGNEPVHALQHLSFLLSALLFWWAVMEGGRGASGYGVASSPCSRRPCTAVCSGR